VTMRRTRRAGRLGNRAASPALPEGGEPTEADVGRFILSVVDGKPDPATQALANACAAGMWLFMVEKMASLGMSAQAAQDRARLYCTEVAEGAVFHA
jgi:hypothetical protein